MIKRLCQLTKPTIKHSFCSFEARVCVLPLKVLPLHVHYEHKKGHACLINGPPDVLDVLYGDLKLYQLKETTIKHFFCSFEAVVH